MVVDDHPMWRDAVARDLADGGLRRGAPPPTAVASARPPGRRRPAGRGACWTCSCPTADGVEVDRALVLEVSPAVRVLVLSASGEHAGRAGGGQGGRDGLSGEVGVRGPSCSTRSRGPRRATRCSRPGWPGWCWGSTGGCRRAGPATGPAAPRLTERETEVLRLVAKGLSYKQIAAERLVLSHRTVQNHVQNTLGKLQLHNRVELVRYAIEHGLEETE